MCHSSGMRGGIADLAADGLMADAMLESSTAADGAAGQADEQQGRSTRWAAWTFAAVVVIALPVILYQGRGQWFFLDEWNFLANRSAGSIHDLLAPHSQHWVTFGVVVYRALWRVVGLRHYW